MRADFTLEGVLTIARAESLYSELGELEVSTSSFSIDAHKVTRVDTAILQLLAGFFTFWVNKGVNIEWLGVSEEFKAAVLLLGLEQVLNISSAN